MQARHSLCVRADVVWEKWHNAVAVLQCVGGGSVIEVPEIIQLACTMANIDNVRGHILRLLRKISFQ